MHNRRPDPDNRAEAPADRIAAAGHNTGAAEDIPAAGRNTGAAEDTPAADHNTESAGHSTAAEDIPAVRRSTVLHTAEHSADIPVNHLGYTLYPDYLYFSGYRFC